MHFLFGQVHLVSGADDGGRSEVFPVDNNHGNAFDFVSGLHFHGLVAQHLDVKRLVHFSEFLAVDAVLFDEIENLFIRSQIDSLHLYRFKNLVVKFVGQFVHGRQGIKHSLVRFHRFTEFDGNAFENNVLFLLPGPVGQRRIECVAMRAEITEEFDDLDFIAGIGWLRYFQNLIINVFLWLAGEANAAVAIMPTSTAAISR